MILTMILTLLSCDRPSVERSGYVVTKRRGEVNPICLPNSNMSPNPNSKRNPITPDFSSRDS